MKKSINTKVTLPHFKRGNLVEMVFNTIRDEILSGKVNELVDVLRRHDQEERLKLQSEESTA